MQPKKPRYGRRLCSLLSRKALFPGRQSSSRWRPRGWELSGEQAGGGHQPSPCVLRAERHFPVGASLPRALLSFAVLSPALQSRLALESERDSCLVGAGLGSASVVSVPAEEAPCLGTLVVPAERNGKPLHLSSLPLALNFEASEEPQGCVATRTGPRIHRSPVLPSFGVAPGKYGKSSTLNWKGRCGLGWVCPPSRVTRAVAAVVMKASPSEHLPAPA